MQILRDPVRLAFAFVGSALLMLVFGFGITTDVEHIRYATFDLDQSPESRAYLEQFAGAPRYFGKRRRSSPPRTALSACSPTSISLVLEIPPNFGRDLRKARYPKSWRRWMAPTFRGETVAQYVQGVQDRCCTIPQ